MQMNNSQSDVKSFGGVQLQDQVVANGACHEENGRTSTKQEVINEPEPSASRVPSNAADTQLSCSESRGSPELIRTISKTEVVKQDVRRLKSVTLDRMGKMFKSRTLVVGRSSLDTSIANVDNCDNKQSWKEKTNSLGRMFKLLDKDGAPRKLFVRPRAGSLSRILRKHPHNENNGVVDRPAEDTTRGIFSRMLNQLRGKSFCNRNYS